MKTSCSLAAFAAGVTFISGLQAADLNITIVTSNTVTSTYTPEDLDYEDPAAIIYKVGYAVRPAADFTGLNAGDTITLDVMAPAGNQFQITPQGTYTFGTYNRWFAFGENVGAGGFSSVSFSLLDLTGNAPTPSLTTTLVYQSSNNASNFLYSASFSSLDAIIFSGFRFRGTLAGSVNAITLPFNERPSFSVSDNNYQGPPPPNDLGILTIIPEPSTYALLLLSGAGWLLWLRRKVTFQSLGFSGLGPKAE